MAELGAKVLLLNRESERSKKMMESLKQEVPSGDFEAFACDLQSLDSVQACAEAIKAKYEKLNAFCANAGIMATEDKATKDGYNAEMQTNVISQFLLLKELFPLLEKGQAQDKDVRVVFHSSGARYGGKINNKYFEKRGGQLGGNGWKIQNAFFSGPRWRRYHYTKLAASVLCYELDYKLKQKGKQEGWHVLVATPGLATTQLQVSTVQQGGMGSGFASWFMNNGMSAADGAMGIIRGMADPADSVGTAVMYAPGVGMAAARGPAILCKLQKFETNQKQADTLWEKLESEVGAIAELS